MSWRGFWATSIGTAIGLAAVLYALLLIVDPYDTVFFSPPFDREPVTTNQRFSFPALARKQRFDSAVIGTSTTRLLEPARFSAALGGSFVNLSLNSGTAWEQAQLFDVFVRRHKRPRTVIFGLDVEWCEAAETYQKYTPRPFPPWMYDDDPWNDLLHLFNLPALEEMARQFAYLTGLRAPKYGKDGYTNFLPPPEIYDLETARRHLYGGLEPRVKAPVGEPVDPAPEARAAWPFATHPLMVEMLRALPDETVKVLMFVPYHHFHQPAPGSLLDAQWTECKRRLTDLAARFENTHVLDFMIHSEITLRDQNYWDPLHYDTVIATRLASLIAEAVKTRRGADGL
ncbi:MAG: hypothetical protein ACE5JZ_13755, partial [Kiloniellales bacterium]